MSGTDDGDGDALGMMEDKSTCRCTAYRLLRDLSLEDPGAVDGNSRMNGLVPKEHWNVDLRGQPIGHLPINVYPTDI